jgi:FdhD protein
MLTTSIGIWNTSVLKLAGTDQKVTDDIIVEEPLEIILKFKHHNKSILKTISITMRTPGDDENLVRGFLFTEGIIKNPLQDIEKFEFRFDCNAEPVEQQTIIVHLRENILPEIENLDRHFYTSSSCGVCGKQSIDLALNNCSFILKKNQPQVEQKILYQLPEILRIQQTLFQKSGGNHGCGLFDTRGNLILFAEDVGRHNAMDKLAGKALTNSLVPLNDHIILLSGRASFELIQKALMIGTPIIAAVGAPSSLAIQTADSFGMSLIGFLKPGMGNIYCHPDRII